MLSSRQRASSYPSDDVALVEAEPIANIELRLEVREDFGSLTAVRPFPARISSEAFVERDARFSSLSGSGWLAGSLERATASSSPSLSLAGLYRMPEEGLEPPTRGL